MNKNTTSLKSHRFERIHANYGLFCAKMKFISSTHVCDIRRSNFVFVSNIVAVAKHTEHNPTHIE